MTKLRTQTQGNRYKWPSIEVRDWDKTWERIMKGKDGQGRPPNIPIIQQDVGETCRQDRILRNRGDRGVGEDTTGIGGGRMIGCWLGGRWLIRVAKGVSKMIMQRRKETAGEKHDLVSFKTEQRSGYVSAKPNLVFFLILGSRMEEGGELGVEERGRSMQELEISLEAHSKEMEGGKMENAKEGSSMGMNRGDQGKCLLGLCKCCVQGKPEENKQAIWEV